MRDQNPQEMFKFVESIKGQFYGKLNMAGSKVNTTSGVVVDLTWWCVL